MESQLGNNENVFHSSASASVQNWWMSSLIYFQESMEKKDGSVYKSVRPLYPGVPIYRLKLLQTQIPVVKLSELNMYGLSMSFFPK